MPAACTDPPPSNIRDFDLNSTTAIEKTLSFFETLSPEQRILFEQLRALGMPMGIVPPVFTPDVAAPSDGPWYSASPSSATETEVLLLATLLTAHMLNAPKLLDEWIP